MGAAPEAEEHALLRLLPVPMRAGAALHRNC